MMVNVHFYKFLQNVTSCIIRLVSYKTKHKSTSDSVLLVDWWEADVRRHRALLRSRFTYISHKLEMLLLGFWFRVFLVHLYTR